MNKKAFSMSINMVVGIVLALLVLLLLTFMIGSRVGLFNTGTSCPAEYAGRCVPEGTCEYDSYTVDSNGKSLCTAPNHVCCPLVG